MGEGHRKTRGKVPGKAQEPKPGEEPETSLEVGVVDLPRRGTDPHDVYPGDPRPPTPPAAPAPAKPQRNAAGGGSR